MPNMDGSMRGVQTTKVSSKAGMISVKYVKSNDAASSKEPALLLIHGNSFCSKVFRHILSSEKLLTVCSQIIAFDLPGHGDSENGKTQEHDYTMKSYATTAMSVCQAMGVHDVVVFGWSLGGHIAIEMIPLPSDDIKMKGIFISGTPPVNPSAKEIHLGFKFGPEEDSWKTALAATEHLTEEQREGIAHYCTDPPYEDWMQECVDRTDGRARRIRFEGFASGFSASEQRSIVESGLSGVLVGVLNGKDEPYINTEFVKSVKYKHLWRNECLEWEGCLHAPFWAKPKEFEELLLHFLNDAMKR
jgi:pimeloyl-ACP methyl ester carboxylesterase